MSDGQPLYAPVDAAVVVLADEAKNGRLAVCAGAGLSRTAGIPMGDELARRVHERFERVTGYACANPDDLVSVADAAARLPSGLDAVQRAVLELGPFSTAPPQLEHRLLALLMAEDALRVLVTNWDDCIERSWRRVEDIPAARNSVEAEALRGQFLLKIHGCCTQRDTLLITSEQLREPGLWTKTYFQAELARSTMVFVGIGDVAHYARTRIVELAELVDNARIRVVSPGIERDWNQSQWSQILPELPQERRIAKPADEFLDQLAREWVMALVREVRRPPNDQPAPWLEAATAAFEAFTAGEALEWLRRTAVQWRVGDSVVMSSAAAALLEAIGLLATERAQDGTVLVRGVRFLRRNGFLIEDHRYGTVICRDRRTPAEIELAVTERVREMVSRVGPRGAVDVLVAATSVRGPRPDVLPGVSVVDPEAPVDDLLAGADEVDVNLIYADDVLQAAA